MGRSLRVLAGVAGWILAVCSGFIFLASAAPVRRASPTFGMDVFVAGFYFAVAVGGVALIRFAWPGQLARIGRWCVALCTSRAGWSNPVVHGLAIYLAAVPLLATTGGASILVATAFFTLYAVASPVLIARSQRFWLHAPLSVVVGITLVGMLPGTAEALSHRRFGDDWMVMLAPFMLYPVLFLGAVVFHVWWRPRATGHVAQQETLR